MFFENCFATDEFYVGVEMNDYLLSICIPTYNRCNYLKKTIKSIITQKEFKEGSVEIVILDNCSNDGTYNYIQNELLNIKNIKCYRNDHIENDYRYLRLLSMANGKLRRLCPDNVIFYKNSLKRIINLINENIKGKPVIFFGDGECKCTYDYEYVNFKDFVINTGYWITNILAFSIWDIDCKNIDKDINDLDTIIWHMRKSLELVYNKGKALIYNKKIEKRIPYIKRNLKYSVFEVFYNNYFNLLLKYFDNKILTEEDKNILEKNVLYNNLSYCMAHNEFFGKKYSKDENLIKTIESVYESKIYFQDFLKYYQRIKFIIFIKLRIKIALEYLKLI